MRAFKDKMPSRKISTSRNHSPMREKEEMKGTNMWTDVNEPNNRDPILSLVFNLSYSLSKFVKPGLYRGLYSGVL